MSQTEFIEKFRHELGGMMLDAATAGLSGAPFAHFMRNVFKKVDSKLLEMWNAMSQKPQPKG